MKLRWFEWEDAVATASSVRIWDIGARAAVEEDVDRIWREYIDTEDDVAYLLDLTARFDATRVTPTSLAVGEEERVEALSKIDSDLRRALEVASVNIRAVAAEQLSALPLEVTLPEGQQVTIRDVPVTSAGIYAPGGRAAYPSSVLMCAIPARVAGVKRITLATPPGPDGKVNPVVLAAAQLCGVDEVFAIGGAQAIFAMAIGVEDTLFPVDVIAGPGNAWVREAKRKVAGMVAIDSLAGPSELMVVIDGDANLRWAALDLCAQAEHGDESPLVAVATEREVLAALAEEVQRAAASRSGVTNALLALVQAPDISSAISFANEFAPEHLELFVADASVRAADVSTAGCVFAGDYSATAFGDYVAGSNHVLPTSSAGHFSGPLGPGTFRRKIATVEITAGAAAKLAPHVNTIARAEGFPVHGESAMIRSEDE
ncbi:MAG: histidinol dehydrogenase [Solirubrobacterales bacterium]